MLLIRSLYLFGLFLIISLLFLFNISSGNLDGVALLSAIPAVVKGGTKLHNEYVVGFSDLLRKEASFTLSITKDNRIRKSSRRTSDTNRVIYSVHPSFAISLNIKDFKLVNSLQSFFGVGNIKQDLSNNAITYYVNSIEDLMLLFLSLKVILSQKGADFILFEKAVN